MMWGYLMWVPRGISFILKRVEKLLMDLSERGSLKNERDRERDKFIYQFFFQIKCSLYRLHILLALQIKSNQKC